ncbi:MAG: TonB family protein [Candidatus Saccharicenans sp.]|jgi:TonB family protein|nr:TonB family protein [Candidatus Saccharicenans sp.]MDH7575904.1 TonB family protein [Candidatus Saccharicenans sp.]
MAKKKLLLIDFDQEFLKFLAGALSDEGFDIITATDGLAGFERFSEAHPDLVIMEAMLPKFHGFELCSRITSHPTKKAPVIIVTGIYKDSVYKTEALRSLGASAFFEKPLNLEELLNKIYELVGRPEPKKAPAPPRPADKELDQLLKEALSMDMEEKKPEPKVKPVEKPRPVEKPAPRPAPTREPSLSKDDEVDLILKSKLKDLMIENSKPEPQPAPRPVTKPEKEKPAARPVETKKTAAPTPDSLLDELIKKPAAAPAAPRPAKVEPTPVESKPQPAPRPRPETKPEPVRESRKETRQVSTPPPSETRPKTSAPVVTPFKGFIEEEKEDKKKEKSRSGTGKYIGLAAAILAIAGAVAFLTLKKKEAPAFSGQTSNQVAALQTGSTGPVSNQPSETEIQQEIEKQMEAYRAQKTQGDTRTQNRQTQGGGRQTSRNAEAAPVAPYIPEQKTSLATMNNPQPAEQSSPAAPAQSETATQTAGTETASGTEEKAADQNQAVSEPQVIIPAQQVKPGDLVPLNTVDVEPKVVKTVEPVYPEADRRMGIKGQVLLNVLISENGDVLEAAVIRGIRGSVALEKEAINAVKKWKFLPAEKNGVKVKVWKPVTIGFGLNK